MLRDGSVMAVQLGPQPLPQVVLSRDIGVNAAREALSRGLVRVCHGAYVAPLTEPSSWEEAAHLARAAVVATSHRVSNGAVFSHGTAALIHGLWLLRTPAKTHITQRSKPRRQAKALRRHTGELPEGDVVEVNGVRVTSIERTIVDCAKSMRPRDALVVADSGMRLLVAPRRDQRGATAERTEALRVRLLAMVEQGARHGRRQARAVIAHADPCSESPYETVVRWIAISRGLPRPVLQMRFEVRGCVYYTDMYWYFELEIDGAVLRLHLIGEYDGELKYLVDADDAGSAGHAAARAVIAEKHREDDLRGLPWTVVQRFDRQDAAQPEATFQRLCAALPPSYVATLRPVPELIGLMQPRGPQ